MGNVRIGKKWPGETIFFQVSAKVRELDSSGNVQRAVNVWQSNTSLRFVNAPAPNRIVFVFSLESAATGRCSSHIGMRGGVQQIRCAAPFRVGTLMHEIGHAIGLYHEHQRPDRNKVVEVFPFSPTADFGIKRPPWAFPVGPYGCASIMHYRRGRFQKVWLSSCATGTTSGPFSITMGQRRAPSTGDLAAVKFLYK
jgi:hypothetical protein